MDLSIDYSALNLTLSDDHRERVVRHVLMNRKMVSEELAQLLNNAIRSYIRIKGFRPSRVSQAPINILTKAVTEVSEDRDELLAAILKVWFSAYPDLRNAVISFLETEGETSKYINDIPDSFSDFWIQDEMTCVNSRAMFTTHSRVMFTSDDRVGVYHFKESFTILLLITPPFFWRVVGSFHLE